MLTGNLRLLLVSCAAVCVLLLFLFPLVHGPFSATHGPITTFRGRKALLALLWLLLCWSKALLFRLKIALGPCGRAPWSPEDGFYDPPAGAKSAVLRC